MSAYPTAARTAVAVEGSVMKATGPAAEVVDRTDQLDTTDTTVKTDDTAVAVNDVDVDDTAAGRYCISIRCESSYHHHLIYVWDHTSEEQSKLLLGVTRSVLLRKKGFHFILQPSRLDDTLLQDTIRWPDFRLGLGSR